MRRTLEEWQEELAALCVGTEYDAIPNGNAQGIAIVPKGFSGPQRICVYPKKRVGAGFVIEEDVYQRVKHIHPLDEPRYKKSSNRPHYSNLSDETILQACKEFLGKY